MPPFTGRAYDDDGIPTPEYAEHWKTFYSLSEVQQAQALARKHLKQEGA